MIEHEGRWPTCAPPGERSLFLKGRSVGEFPLVIHGRFLGDERHVRCCCAIDRSSKNAVVGIRCSGEWLPSAACKRVVTFLAGPNAHRDPSDFLVLANRAGVPAGPLGHSRSGVASDGNTVPSSKPCCCASLLGSLCQSVPLRLCYHFSKFNASLLGHIEDLGKLGGSEHPF